MPTAIDRRAFLKLLGLTLAATGWAFREFPPGGDPALLRPPSFALGRVIYSERYYDQPTTTSRELGYYVRDAVVKIEAQAVGDPYPTHNPVWLRTDKGWLHSAYVQPVEDRLNQPVKHIPAGGMLVQVTMPFTQAYASTDRGRKPFYRCYYGSTYWAQSVFTDGLGTTWYSIWDERNETNYQVQADHLRPVLAEEVTPISPGVSGKEIRVDLQRQRLVCYEGSQPVFTTRIATGVFEGTTPIGAHRIERKTPSRHMASNAEGNAFDLPGVPWVCYISWTGVSIHGTYWHHNYGTPQSHGCINLLPEAALWVYRWSDPFVPINEDYVETDNGTQVVIF